MQTNPDGSVNTYDADGNKTGTVDAETLKEMTTVNDDVSELATRDNEQETSQKNAEDDENASNEDKATNPPTEQENSENGANTEPDKATEEQQEDKSYKYPNMVFTSTTGDYKDRSRLNLQFKRFIKDTEFSNISLHKLRHANATLLINAGVDLKLVSENLGHSDVSVTANIYSEVLESSKKKMADLVALNLK